jgi:hypothetical protein
MRGRRLGLPMISGFSQQSCSSQLQLFVSSNVLPVYLDNTVFSVEVNQSCGRATCARCPGSVRFSVSSLHATRQEVPDSRWKCTQFWLCFQSSRDYFTTWKSTSTTLHLFPSIPLTQLSPWFFRTSATPTVAGFTADISLVLLTECVHQPENRNLQPRRGPCVLYLSHHVPLDPVPQVGTTRAPVRFFQKTYRCQFPRRVRKRPAAPAGLPPGQIYLLEVLSLAQILQLFSFMVTHDMNVSGARRSALPEECPPPCRRY